MKHIIIVPLLLVTLLSPAAGAVQDKREQGTYTQMREYLGELFAQRKYAEAAAMLERVMDRFPDHFRANAFNLAAAYVLIGDPGKAMTALESAARRSVFYSKWDFEGETMARLKTHPRFQAFWARNLELHAEAQGKARMQLEVATPPGYDQSKTYPLFVALHGGGETTAMLKPNWVSPRLQGEFIIAYVQSSQVASMTGFTWEDEAATRRDLEAAYKEVVAKYRVDTRRVIVGGFSSGGFASLVATFHQVLPVRGFVALCPAVPTTISDAEVKAAVTRGIRGALLTTEQDGRVAEQRALAERLKAAGLDTDFNVTPNTGHWFPADFSQQLDRAIGRILPVPEGGHI